VLLRGRAQDARDDLLRGCAARRAVAAADLARDHRRADRLLGLPVRRFDVGAAQAGEERRALGLEVVKEAAVRLLPSAASAAACVPATVRNAEGKANGLMASLKPEEPKWERFFPTIWRRSLRHGFGVKYVTRPSLVRCRAAWTVLIMGEKKVMTEVFFGGGIL
jgi:hypothetical protein